MTKSELIEIVKCISESKSQWLCDRLNMCNMMMPEQVRSAVAQCERTIHPKGQKKCSETEMLYPSADVIAKIFDCVNDNTKKLTAEESKKMVEFETCSRNLYVGNCKLTARVKQDSKAVKRD
ncbi:uncharacterized protein TNIN_374671 [Trichonephila inaurata madagascariensis]|uniref:Uncharacterized protein n=1 Tax=Trichonephila inaurata madagascariensis TaxID=2747483 RepID=A0A8X6I4Y3_9ARAC|nr:uncharacterized protein TNIN_374671 [Trichonephila inaurata madagascariensis]